MEKTISMAQLAKNTEEIATERGLAEPVSKTKRKSAVRRDPGGSRTRRR